MIGGIRRTAIHRFARNAFTQYAPTRRAATLMAVAAVVWLASGTSTGQTIAAAVTALVVLALLVDAIRLPGVPHITLARTVPSVVGLEEPTMGEYTLHSRWPMTCHATIHHTPRMEVTLTVPSTPIVLQPSQTITVPITVLGRSRGWHTPGPAAVRVLGVWGLVSRTLTYHPSDTITVVPSIAGGRKHRLAAVQQRMRMAGTRVLRRRGTGTAFANLREYAMGDDPRHIDWKATARHNRLVSREFTMEQGQTVIIAVDAGRMMTQMSHDRPRFEYALASALTLADVALAAGDLVGLMVFDAELREYIPPARGGPALRHIRDALARSSAALVEPDYAAAFRTLATRHRRRSLIVLFTDVIDVRSSRAVIANTIRSAHRHLPLMVALRNDHLAAAAIPTIPSPDMSEMSLTDAYTSVAAEELLSARNEALLSMRQSGVSVLDVEPTAMTTALINRYLDIKERAQL